MSTECPLTDFRSCREDECMFWNPDKGDCIHQINHYTNTDIVNQLKILNTTMKKILETVNETKRGF